jgi:hypothetical protein
MTCEARLADGGAIQAQLGERTRRTIGEVGRKSRRICVECDRVFRRACSGLIERRRVARGSPFILRCSITPIADVYRNLLEFAGLSSMSVADFGLHLCDAA